MVCADLDLDLIDRTQRSFHATDGCRLTERVVHRHPVDLPREWSEPGFIGCLLRRQCHRQRRPAMIGVIETDHGVTTSRPAGDLHRILHGLRSRVEQRRLLREVAGGLRRQQLANPDIRLVRADHETGVGEVGRCLGDRGHDGRGRSPDGRDRDTRAQIDQLIAVSIHQDAAIRAHHIARRRGCDPCTDHRIAASGQG